MLIGMIIILAIICFTLLLLLHLDRREIKNIIRQLRELKGVDTNALLHVENGFIPTDLLNEINSLLEECRANRAYYAHKRHELEQMITNISHDLCTPLTSAMGYIDIILHSDLPAGEKCREISIVGQRLERLEDLIHSFFEFSQMIAREHVPEKKELNLVAILEEAIAHYYDDYCAKGRSITLNCEKSRFKVFSNQNMLLRIFDNLIGNSLKHGTGNLAISVQVCDASICPTETSMHSIPSQILCTDIAKDSVSLSGTEQSSPTLSIRFENALNSPCPDLARIFDEFYTTDISRTRGNTGLGLAIAKQLTEMLGGRISASYEDGVFCIMVVFA
ncbi:MAG: HAMP domain-containing histidine kinase [Lachnospiraceae bacterium]|nr:HAMP domain-containing histidine kinase [Lachnospiraceae bacterium]